MKYAINLEGDMLQLSSWVLAIDVNYFNMSLVLVKKIVETYFLFLIGNIKLFKMYSIHKKNAKKLIWFRYLLL
jgi:hypothetical protein